MSSMRSSLKEQIMNIKNETLTAIDLFCGAGGLSDGFRQAGFKILAGNDIMPSAGATFRSTHSDSIFYSNPASELSARQIFSDTGLKKGDLDCLIGGPPCQGFSVYNHRRGLHDPRSHLFRDFLSLVNRLQPKWVVIENVTGIFSAGGGKAVEDIIEALDDLNYQADVRILKAEEYGVPQVRRRAFFVANRLGVKNPFPIPSHGEDLLPLVTVKDAIYDLPQLDNGEDLGDLEYLSYPISKFQKEMRKNSTYVTCHAAARLGTINVERMKYIPPGGSWRDIPYDLLPAGMKRAKRSDHTKRYGRLEWGGLASTILTKCDVHWGAYIHPEQDRSITVREAARLQSFPDTFIFSGSRTEQYVQVGNAVPPLLGKAIAQSIKKCHVKAKKELIIT